LSPLWGLSVVQDIVIEGSMINASGVKSNERSNTTRLGWRVANIRAPIKLL
jgi:hypothetical protein